MEQMTMRTRDIRALQDKAARSRCPDHPEHALKVIHGIIVCESCLIGGRKPPFRIEAIPSETQKYMTGQTQSAAIHQKMSQKHGAWEMTTEVTDVALIEPTQKDIEAVAQRFAKQIDGFGPQLPVKDVTMAAQLAAVGFQHFHFNVIQGGLYLNLRGREFNAQRAMGLRFGGVTIEIQTDEVKKAAGVGTDEVMVKATLWEKDGKGGRTIRMEDFGRAGGNRDRNQPVAKMHTLEMATARAKCRVLIAGAPLGVPIGSYSEEVGLVVSDGPGQVAALPERTPATWPAPDEAVNEETGEVTTGQRKVPLVLAEIIIGKIVEAGINKDDLKRFVYSDAKGDEAVIEMLRDGRNADAVVNAIIAQLKPPDGKPVVTVDEETNEDVQSLPW